MIKVYRELFYFLEQFMYGYWIPKHMYNVTREITKFHEQNLRIFFFLKFCFCFVHFYYFYSLNYDII